MLFMIHCVDKDGAQDLRAANREAHLTYLKGFADKIFAAGPLLREDGEGMAGSLLLMEFPDRAAVEAFAREDPYAKSGVFQSVEIKAWKKVLP